MVGGKAFSRLEEMLQALLEALLEALLQEYLLFEWAEVVESWRFRVGWYLRL